MITVAIHDILCHPKRGEAWLVPAKPGSTIGLPIFVGSSSPKQVFSYFNRGAARPSTPGLAVRLVEESGARIREVRIIGVVDNTFRAAVVLETPSGLREVDARPSDAVALAHHADRPIRVDEELMAATGKPLTEAGAPADLPQGFESTRSLWSGPA